MTPKELRLEIRKKHGSVTKFCAQNKIPITDMINLTRIKDESLREMRIKQISAILKKARVKPEKGELTDKLREKIRVAIVVEYESYSAFCTAHNIPATWLSTLLNGGYKRTGKRVKKLCNLLHIKL